MGNKFLAKVATLGFVVSLLCSGCGSGVTVLAMVSPTINQVSPQVVTAGTPNVTVTVQGANFQSQAALTVNGTAVPTTFVNSTTLAAKISGSPLAQPAVAQLQVRNNDGSSSNQVPLTVTSAPDGGNSLAITTSVLPDAQNGVAYTDTFTATGGTSPYTWTVSSGTLPAGLTLSTGGVLSGTPTASGSYTFSITVTDSHMLTKTIAFSLLVSAGTTAQALRITTTTMPAAQVATTYSTTLSASGGTPSYTWSISSGSLPAGLTLSSGGVISGTPTTAGTTTFTVAVRDRTSAMATAQESITVSAAGLSITTTSLAAATNGAAYSATLSATGGTPSYTWSVSSGTLPAGLTLSSAGVISGTPTSTGTSTFTVAVKDSGSHTATAQESITVSAAALTITTTSLAAATNGTAYSATLSATGGTPSYTWSVSSGSLPAGLTLSSGGVISGTPTATGTSTFTVAVKDSASHTAMAQESITVSAAGLSITTTSLAAATNGTAYSATLSATGGTPSYTWSISSGSLPSGLTLSSKGVISGTPKATGTSTFTVAVKDSGSHTATQQESITVSAPGLTITTTSLIGATSGSSYNSALSASGGTPGYTWSISSGNLPAGLTLSNAGVISGTSTAIGTATFTVAVKDSGSGTATQQESITVSPAGLTITTTTLAAATNGSAYSAPLSSTGGTPGYTWSISSGSLPAGLTLSSGGVISGTPTATGTSKFTVAVKDSGSPTQIASAQESITVAAAAPKLAITSTSLGAAQTGSSYSTTLSATGGAPSYTWWISSGSLPTGLTLSSAGVISGTPTATGNSTFTVAVTDSSSPTQSASVQESIAVTSPQLTVTTTALSYGTTGSNYSATVSASGGSPSYTWSVASGSLPAGLSISSTGVISGTPTATGTSTFTVSVSDGESPTQTATAQESITISAPVAPGSAQIYVYPQTPVAPRGSYQTVTAIVTGVNDKTVTWTSDGGTIVGTNPCVVNEPCTVALYATTAGTYHLTATSNSNHSVVASSTITMTASPVQRTDHPRFMITSDMLPALRAKAIPSNVPYAALKQIATTYYNIYSSSWTYSTWNGNACTGGSGPSTDQTYNYTEWGAWWMAIISELDSDPSVRNQFGCAARDVFITNANYVISGQLSLIQGNRWADSALAWSYLTDYLMGGGYLSAADINVARQYLAKLADEQINDIYNGDLAVIGNYNSPTQFDESDENSSSLMRAMGNNYTHARIMILSAGGLTFNDNTTDDPPLTNTCSATRYQVCPDGTAGSLHAYWSYVTGGMLYKDWADMDDPNVVQQAYNAAFTDLSSQPACNTLWSSPIPCLGMGRGGESSEGTSYGASMEKLRMALNAIHTAGYDDPLLYGPQMSMGTMSYWDLRYVADLSLETGLSGAQSQKSMWNTLTDGDTLYYYTYPSNYGTESATLTADSYVGRTDRTAALQWLVMNSAFGMGNGQAGGCTSYCGLDYEMADDYASGVALDMFLSLPAGDPQNNLPADPRPSLPTDWYNAGNQHIVVRDGGWTTGANTIFSYYCTNTQIDHEHQYCGRFDLYSQGEYITKGRMEFNDYINEMSTARNENLPVLMNNPTQTGCTYANCYFADATVLGGQLWHGYQAGLNTLYYSELPGYVATVANSTNSYNGGWGGFGQLNGINAASRSLLYLRGSNVVIYYDRGDSGSNSWEKANYLVTTGQPSFSGNTATWLTRSGNQKVSWTELEPSGSAPTLDMAYTDQDASYDWEIYGRIMADAGQVPSARFLSVLQWGPASSSAPTATSVKSTSGTSFEGAMVGSSLVMFMHDWPASFTSVTYPASGAVTQYVSDLTPNTTYSISGAGVPSTATTDNAGVLAFSASGSGNITIAPSGH